MGSAGKLAILPFEICSGVKENFHDISLPARHAAFRTDRGNGVSEVIHCKCEEVRRNRIKRASAAHGTSRGIWISSQVMKVSPSRGVGGDMFLLFSADAHTAADFLSGSCRRSNLQQGVIVAESDGSVS